MMQKNFSTREKYIAVITAVLVMSALVYGFIIEPAANQWASLNDEIQAKREILSKGAKILARKKAIEKDYVELSKYLAVAGDEEGDAGEMMNFIETASRDASCLLGNIKPLGVRNLGSYKESLVEIVAEGSMEQLSKFIYNIDNSGSMMLKIKRFTMNSKPQAGVLKGTFLVNKVFMN